MTPEDHKKIAIELAVILLKEPELCRRIGEGIHLAQVSARQKVEVEIRELCRKMHKWGSGAQTTCAYCGVDFRMSPTETNLNEICPKAPA